MAKGNSGRSKRQEHAGAVARRAQQARLARVAQVPLPPDAKRYVDGVLAGRQETADEGWLAGLLSMGESGRPGEAIEQVEPFVRDHLHDEQAALAYARLVRQAAAMEPKGDRERNALERFTDRSGLAETKHAVTQFLSRHPDWDEFVKDRAVQDFQLVPGKLLSAEAVSECAALILEANVRGADLAMKGKTSKQTIGLKAVSKMLGTAQGMPLAELDPPEPVPYDDPPPHGVRWKYFTPLGPLYAAGSGNILMMLAGRLLADVALRRVRGPHPGKFADDPVPTTRDWADTPLQRLYGLTPREAAEADVPYQMLLESMLRALEYQAALALPGEDVADVPALRQTLGMRG